MTLIRSLWLAGILAVAGCGGGGEVTTVQSTPPPPNPTPSVPATVVLQLGTTNLTVGGTIQASAIVSDAAGKALSGIALSWSSSNAAVATVTQQGLVTAISEGSATITVTVGALTASATLAVAAKPPVPTPEGLAALPQVYLNTAAPSAPAAGGKVISVAAGGNLQTAINSALPGDVIELAAGATYVGNFVLQNKSTTSTDWIVIRPANYASLPPEGTRMTPAVAAQLNLPKLVAANNLNVIATALSAHHYRLTGLEVTVTAGTTQNYGLIAFDGAEAQTSLAVVPHDLVIDRSYVHGTSTVFLRRCVLLNSASSAVIDSWLSDCHDKGADSQAIASYNGPGPFKIVNNYLEGAGENVIFGGADPLIRNLVPSDIEIRRNHFFKPLSWKTVWLVKNLLETKNVQRVLIEGNLMENSWSDGQNGLAIGIKSVNQSGGCTWCVSQDITVRGNLIRNVGAVFNIASSPDNNFQTIHARRISVTNNIGTNINIGPFNGDGRGFTLLGDPADVLIAHNTLMSPSSSAFTFGPAGSSTIRLTARDNLVHGGTYGVVGDDFIGGPALVKYAPDGTFMGNVLILINGSSGYPTGNFYPSNVTSVGFLNAGALDFNLLASSPYKGKATDGRDPGADVDVINTLLIGVP